jgi:hypothetical protein
MTLKDKKLTKVLELVHVQGRIEELQRSKTWLSSSNYYRERLTALETKEDDLKNDLDINDDEGCGSNDPETIKFTLRLPEKFLKGKRDNEDFVQYLKRTILVEE